MDQGGMTDNQEYCQFERMEDLKDPTVISEVTC